MKNTNIGVAAFVGVFLSVLGAVAAQDRYTRESPERSFVF